MPARKNYTLPPELANAQYVPLSGALAVSGLRRSWIYDAVSKKIFPAPVRIGRAARWRMSDLLRWADDPDSWAKKSNAKHGA